MTVRSYEIQSIANEPFAAERSPGAKNRRTGEQMTHWDMCQKIKEKSVKRKFKFDGFV